MTDLFDSVVKMVRRGHQSRRMPAQEHDVVRRALAAPASHPCRPSGGEAGAVPR